MYIAVPNNKLIRLHYLIHYSIELLKTDFSSIGGVLPSTRFNELYPAVLVTTQEIIFQGIRPRGVISIAV